MEFDLVVSHGTVIDGTGQPPSGIRAVVISGEVVVEGGAVVARERHGRVLRR